MSVSVSYLLLFFTSSIFFWRSSQMFSDSYCNIEVLGLEYGKMLRTSMNSLVYFHDFVSCFFVPIFEEDVVVLLDFAYSSLLKSNLLVDDV
jgi:hypothetical protein